ncbi:MAG TPA: MaoC family dehydratase N-terminal domain-containing protein [Candidatus Dormibacteraeota bacterium]|nr:MaoC family dehydratase N-terminal domain-containing protein [Candidatus Dormibacteraeota bacterium]
MTITIVDAIDRVKTRIGVEGPPVTTTVEAGHLRRFVEAIDDPNPRWTKEAPPTFLVALAPAALHMTDAEDFGKGWLNGGNRFEYFAPVMVGDQITARSHVADVYDKAGATGSMLFIVFETDYKNQRGELVARLRGTIIRR